MNKIDTLTWSEEFGQGFNALIYRGKTLRIWLFGLFFHIGFGQRA